eukprot:scpid81075/ scgid7912/ 
MICTVILCNHASTHITHGTVYWLKSSVTMVTHALEFHFGSEVLRQRAWCLSSETTCRWSHIWLRLHTNRSNSYFGGNESEVDCGACMMQGEGGAYLYIMTLWWVST